MLTQAIKTHKITVDDTDLLKIIDQYVTSLTERSVLVITSKIVSICEGNIVKVGEKDKYSIVEEEADYYIPRELNKYHTTVTIKHNILACAAGLDESNGNGYYILLPKDPQKTANTAQKYIKQKFGLKECGVIITDSRSIPLQRGTLGAALAHSGFLALNNYIGSKDLFGKVFEVSMANVSQGLASAAVLVMGEGVEQTPLAVVSDLPFVQFVDHDPDQNELTEIQTSIESDIFHQLLEHAPWKTKHN